MTACPNSYSTRVRTSGRTNCIRPQISQSTQLLSISHPYNGSNIFDAYGRNLGSFIGTKLPFILGTNLAGTVQSLGPFLSTSSNKPKYKVGDHTFGQAAFLDSPIPNLACNNMPYSTLLQPLRRRQTSQTTK